MKVSIKCLPIFLFLFAGYYGFDLDFSTVRVLSEKPQDNIIGTIENKPEGFGCYAVRKKDWDLPAEKRPYVFIKNDDGKGLMNIEGKDILLDEKEFTDVNKTGKNKKIKWTYKDENYQASFDLTITKTTAEAYHIYYAGKLTVSTSAKTQTIPIKATCYD